MMRTPCSQTGATLIVSLMMLAILALLGANAVNNSTTELRIAANMQSQQDAAAAIQDAIEQVIGSPSTFLTPQAQTIRIQRANYGDTLEVQVAAPVCRSATPSEGYSAITGPPTEDAVWEVVASVTDPATGARAEVHQGVAVLMRLGSCPAPVTP
jgi:Tfp pilus assembly protein PilX